MNNKVTINGREYTPFESCNEVKIWQKVIVLSLTGMDKSNWFNVWDILEVERIWFSDVCFFENKGFWMCYRDLAPYTEPKEEISEEEHIKNLWKRVEDYRNQLKTKKDLNFVVPDLESFTKQLFKELGIQEVDNLCLKEKENPEAVITASEEWLNNQQKPEDTMIKGFKVLFDNLGLEWNEDNINEFLDNIKINIGYFQKVGSKYKPKYKIGDVLVKGGAHNGGSTAYFIVSSIEIEIEDWLETLYNWYNESEIRLATPEEVELYFKG